ncbi:hypothetical protein MAR_001789 [Mya arenaria]|uniref:Uncharacterized protein n=1 Tax=Mya arenaria TaxID=6604 RepID=A0ABY7FG64_MYAAR|nr:hypothetical protein MAR_001789 [Mya arenaria]
MTSSFVFRYRERQKAKGTTFREKEKARQRQYYVPASQLSSKKRATRNTKNKLRNRLSRLRKRQQQERNNNNTAETSGYETLNTESEHDGEQNNQPGPSVPSLERLIVKLPNVGKGSTQIEPISKKAKLTQSDTSHLTPKKKTLADLEALSLTPKRKRIARRQLLTCNVLMHEIHGAKKASGQKKGHTSKQAFIGTYI